MPGFMRKLNKTQGCGGLGNTDTPANLVRGSKPARLCPAHALLRQHATQNKSSISFFAGWCLLTLSEGSDEASPQQYVRMQSRRSIFKNRFLKTSKSIVVVSQPGCSMAVLPMWQSQLGIPCDRTLSCQLLQKPDSSIIFCWSFTRNRVSQKYSLPWKVSIN